MHIGLLISTSLCFSGLIKGWRGMASYCLLLIALFGFVSMAVSVEKHQNTLLWFYSKAVEIDFCVLIFQNVIFFSIPNIS